MGAVKRHMLEEVEDCYDPDISDYDMMPSKEEKVCFLNKLVRIGKQWIINVVTR
jgi:hypothetical protein